MPQSKTRDLKTQALVLRRMNYGETDRILVIITPEGKKSVLAKGVRREKSKLAGGIEMFCLSEITIHQGRSELVILTSAKMQKFYKNLLTDLEKLEVASEILKRIIKAAEASDSPEHFALTRQGLEALNVGANTEITMAWFYFNLARVSGEQVNLFYDKDDEKLEEQEKYSWDSTEKALKKAKAGKIGANEIKMMRLMLSADLSLVLRVKEAVAMAPELLYIAKTLNQI